MDVSIPCPECGRKARFPEIHLGRRFKCPGCGAVVATERPGSGSPPDRSPDDAPRDRASAGRRGAPRQDFPTWTTAVRVKHDPRQALRGVLGAEITPDGMVLRSPKGDAEVARVPVGTRARYNGGSMFEVEVDGRPVVLLVGSIVHYSKRLAEDLARFLAGEKGRIVPEDYAVPLALTVATFLPAGIAFVGMQGGAIGGGIGGAIAGCFVAANVAVVRREAWPVAARFGACVAISIVGYSAVAMAFLAISAGLRGAN